MQKNKTFIWIWGGVFAAFLILSTFIPFGILAAVLMGTVSVAILWDRHRRPQTQEPRPVPPDTGAFRTPLGTKPVFMTLGVNSPLTLRVKDGVTLVETELHNGGNAPIGPLSFELAITFTNVFGNPAKSGNNWDGFVLSPPPEPVTLGPGEVLSVIVYRSDAPPSLPPDGERHEKLQKVLDALKAAPNLISFLRDDTTDAFDLHLRVGDYSHAAALSSARVKEALVQLGYAGG